LARIFSTKSPITGWPSSRARGFQGAALLLTTMARGRSLQALTARKGMPSGHEWMTARPGYAEIRKESEQLVGPGEVVTFQPDSIHSVINDTDRVSVSLHVYGRHVNHTHRSRFDPDQRTEAAFVLKVD
jgi:hypothetical protein